MIITQENLFQWNIEKVLSRIENDYSKEIMAAYDSGESETLLDWLEQNPAILGKYMIEQLNDNFDFEAFSER